MSGTPFDVAFGLRRIAWAWSGALGACRATVEHTSALVAETSRHVGPAGIAVCDVSVAWVRDEPWVALATEREAWLVAGGDAPLALGLGARAIELVEAGGTPFVFGVDTEGLWGARLDARTGRFVWAPRRLVHRPDVRSGIAAFATGARVNVAYGLDDASLGVLRCPMDADETPRDVRHPLVAPLVEVRAASVGRVAGLAIGYGGARVDRVTFGSEGAVHERPHPALLRDGATLAFARPVWLGSHFGVAALDVEAREVRVEDASTDARVVAVVPDVVGPFAADVREHAVLVAQLRRDGDSASLSIFQADLRSGLGRAAAIGCTPGDVASRRRAFQSAWSLRGLEDELAPPGYRGRGATRTHGPSTFGAALGNGLVFARFDADGSVLEAHASADPEDVLDEHGIPRVRALEEEGVFAGLARFVALHLPSAEAALQREDEAALEAAASTFRASLEVVRAGAALRIRVSLVRVPDVGSLRVFLETALRRAAVAVGR